MQLDKITKRKLVVCIDFCMVEAKTLAQISQPDKWPQLDLDALEPDKPALAGQVILQLAERVLAPEKKNQARRQLSEQLFPDSADEYSKIAGWCRGEFVDSKRPMTPDDFQKLAMLFWQKPGGLQTIDDVLSLARCIGYVKVGSRTIRSLVDHLDRGWLEGLGYVKPQDVNLPVRDSRYIHTPINLPRTDFLRQLVELFPLAQNARRPIVILGQPGTGKTKFIEYLENQKWPGQPSDEMRRIVYLNGGSLQPHLRAWYQDQIGVSAQPGVRQDDLLSALQSGFRKKRVAIFLDDLNDYAEYSTLYDLLLKAERALIVITTSSERLAHNLVDDERLLLRIPRFRLDEAQSLYELRNGKLASSQEPLFIQLCETLKFNPLAMSFAFQQANIVGLETLLGVLTGLQIKTPAEIQPEIFLALQVGFERMPKALQDGFSRLGALKRFYAIDERAFCALWANSPDQMAMPSAREIFRQIQEALSPFIGHHQIQNQWRLHQQTHLFALEKFSALPKSEQDLALAWVERAERLYSMPELSLAAPSLENFKLLTHSYIPEREKDSETRVLFQLLFLVNRNWDFAQRYADAFTSEEYFIASNIRRRSRAGAMFLWSFLIVEVFAQVVGSMFPDSTPYILLGMALVIIPWVIFFMRFSHFWNEFTGIVLWQHLWRTINDRIKAQDG